MCLYAQDVGQGLVPGPYTDERAELYGGHLDARPSPGGGFAVTAAIPCPDSTVPGSTVPGSTVPGSTVPDSTVPGSTVPGNTVPDSTVPDNTVSDGTVPERA